MTSSPAEGGKKTKPICRPMAGNPKHEILNPKQETIFEKTKQIYERPK